MEVTPYRCTLIIPRLSLTWKVFLLKKWFRQTLSLKFSSSPNRQNRLAPAVGLKQNGFMITVYKRSRTFPYWENMSSCSFANAATSAHTAANGSRNPIRSSPATTAGPADWHFTLSPCSGRPFPENRSQSLPVFPSRRSAAFWTRFAILRLTSFHKRFPLTNSKAMLLPVNISAFWLIRKSAGSSTFSRIGHRARSDLAGTERNGNGRIKTAHSQ